MIETIKNLIEILFIPVVLIIAYIVIPILFIYYIFFSGIFGTSSFEDCISDNMGGVVCY